MQCRYRVTTVKNRLHSQSHYHKMLTDGLERCELLVDYCDVFISCLDSDGTHSLQRIHWWTGDVMLHFYKSVLMKKHLHLGWPEGREIFGWTNPLIDWDGSLYRKQQKNWWKYRLGQNLHKFKSTDYFLDNKCTSAHKHAIKSLKRDWISYMYFEPQS